MHKLSDIKQLQNHLLQWYHNHKRNLPWRSTSNPYLIWVSEVILQQTRVAQGLDYYLRFIKQFPDVISLAQASEEEVLKLWQGLGYYSRARNMHAAAKQVVNELTGIFPKTYNALISLKGIGPYTAAAVASISANEAVAVVDGNVERVLSRLTGVKEAVNSTKGKKQIQQLANDFLNHQEAGHHNQAVMELGALVCTPKNPECEQCPIQSACFAYAHNTQDIHPIKNKKSKQRKRYFHYFLVEHDKKILVRKREAGDIWQGLYELVLLEEEKKASKEKMLAKFLKSLPTNVNSPIISYETSNKHVLSHQIIYADFFRVRCDAPVNLEGYQLVSEAELSTLPISRLTEKYLDAHFF